MEKELQEYLDRITKEIIDIKETMATKKDLEKVERRLTKKINETIEYVKDVDEAVSSHRRNTEMHVPASRKA